MQDDQIVTGLFDVAGDSVGTMRIFSNPAENTAVIRFGQALAGDVRIEVADLNGRVLRSVQANGGPGTGDVPLEISGLAGGMYTAYARDVSGVFAGKLAIR